MHVTAWPDEMPEVLPLLYRLRRLHPDTDTQTHVLHLASTGAIAVRFLERKKHYLVDSLAFVPQPHVDNVDAFGYVHSMIHTAPYISPTMVFRSWILGVSLGDPRSMRLEARDKALGHSYEMVLPSGSVYLQRQARRNISRVKTYPWALTRRYRGDLRYNYTHSISLPAADGTQHAPTTGRQRVSIMIRVNLVSFTSLQDSVSQPAVRW